MTNTSWQLAIEQYRAAEQQKAEVAKPVTEAELGKGHFPAARDLGAATADLRIFLDSSEGRAAVELLQVSKSFVRIGEEEPCMGYTTVYVLDGQGLRSSYEGSGMWLAYAKPAPTPKLSAISAAEAVEAFVRLSGKSEEELVPFLREGIQRIADAAPAAAVRGS